MEEAVEIDTRIGSRTDQARRRRLVHGVPLRSRPEQRGRPREQQRQILAPRRRDRRRRRRQDHDGFDRRRGAGHSAVGTRCRLGRYRSLSVLRGRIGQPHDDHDRLRRRRSGEGPQETDRREGDAERRRRADRDGDAEPDASRQGAELVRRALRRGGSGRRARPRARHEVSLRPRLRPHHQSAHRPQPDQGRRADGHRDGAARGSRLRPAQRLAAQRRLLRRAHLDASRRAGDRRDLHRVGRRVRSVRREEHGRGEQGAGAGGGRQCGGERDRRPDEGSADHARQARRGAGGANRSAVMKAFTNASPRDLTQAVTLIRQSRDASRSVAIAGGGSDLLGMMKERLVTPDVVVHLKAVKNLDQVKQTKDGVTIGGLITLDALGAHPLIRKQYAVLAEAAEGVATPQIRNVATLAGNLNQRPWCWYYRNGFKCLKNGGTTCYSVSGENEFHAIFGGGPSYIVHPSDTAPALVALDATFRIVGPAGERVVPASEFFTLPTVDPARENVLKDGEVLAEIVVPARAASTRSTYHKILDREAWTHAVVSARVVLGGVAPIPWRLPEVEKMLAGQRMTPDLAAKAGEAAVAGARPLAKNGYKVPLTRNMVKRTLEAFA